MMKKEVFLVDIANNKILKKVGFSYLYLFLGPFYLLVRFIPLGLPLLILYYFLLPIPGIVELCSFLTSLNLNNGFINFIINFLMFFRSSWTSLQPYICILFVICIHISLSFRIDNFLLKREIKRKNLSPLTQKDAYILIYYKVCKYDVKLANQLNENQFVIDKAKEDWEKQNFNYNAMLNQSDIKRKKSRLFKTNTNTSDVSKPYEKKSTTEQNLINKQHLNNLKLYQEHKITKQEYELLEDRLYKNL